jgi:hypothetical protein
MAAAAADHSLAETLSALTLPLMLVTRTVARHALAPKRKHTDPQTPAVHDFICGLRHLTQERDDVFLRAVAAELLLVLLAHNWKGIEDVSSVLVI